MSFPRYPKYKNGGVQWQSELPASWSPVRLRFLLKDGHEGMKIRPFGSQLISDVLLSDGPYKVYGQENIIAGDFGRGSRFLSEDKFRELSSYEIKPGDVLITMMGTSGRCGVAPRLMQPGVMDSHLLRIRVNASVSPEFLSLLIDDVLAPDQLFVSGVSHQT